MPRYDFCKCRFQMKRALLTSMQYMEDRTSDPSDLPTRKVDSETGELVVM